MRNELFVDDEGGKVRIIAGKDRKTGQIVFPRPQGAEEED